MEFRNIIFLLGGLSKIGCGTSNAPSSKISENLNSNIAFSEIDFLGEYAIVDEIFGTITQVTIIDDKRVMHSNALPNHTTGTFPNQGNPNTISPQEVQYSFPLIQNFQESRDGLVNQV